MLINYVYMHITNRTLTILITRKSTLIAIPSAILISTSLFYRNRLVCTGNKFLFCFCLCTDSVFSIVHPIFSINSYTTQIIVCLVLFEIFVHVISCCFLLGIHIRITLFNQKQIKVKSLIYLWSNVYPQI